MIECSWKSSAAATRKGAAREKKILVRGIRPQRECEREEQYSLCLVHLAEVLLLHSDGPRDLSPESSSATLIEDMGQAIPRSITSAMVLGRGEGKEEEGREGGEEEGGGEGGREGGGGGGGGGVGEQAEDLSNVQTKMKTDLDPALGLPPDDSPTPVHRNSLVEGAQFISISNPDMGPRKRKSRQKMRRTVRTAARGESFYSDGDVPMNITPSTSHGNGHGVSHSDDHDSAYLQQTCPALIGLGSGSGSDGGDVSNDMDLEPSAICPHTTDITQSASASVQLSMSVVVPVVVPVLMAEDGDQCREAVSDPDLTSSFSFASMFSDILTKKRVEIAE